MNGRMLNRFSRHASKLTQTEVRLIMEEAQKEQRHGRICLLLWLGLRSGARLVELLMLRTDEAWNGYVPVWSESDGEVVYVGVCKDRRELEWLRECLERYQAGQMVFDVKARTVNSGIKTVCKRAGVELEGGYAAVVRTYDEIKQGIHVDKMVKWASELV